MKTPKVTFRTREGDNQSLGGGCAIGGKWKDISSDDLFKGKKLFYFHCPEHIHPLVPHSKYLDMKINTKS